jgi:ferredoxin
MTKFNYPSITNFSYDGLSSMLRTETYKMVLFAMEIPKSLIYLINLVEYTMATIYFSSPIMTKNKKVNAVAGKRDTLLAVAKDNNIKIPFECEDGECGSCLIKVTHLDGDHIKGVMLTDKEREVLKSIGKLPKYEEERANVQDIPPTFRLACQTVVTDEDLLVQFTGEPGGA